MVAALGAGPDGLAGARAFEVLGKLGRVAALRGSGAQDGEAGACLLRSRRVRGFLEEAAVRLDGGGRLVELLLGPGHPEERLRVQEVLRASPLEGVLVGLERPARLFLGLPGITSAQPAQEAHAAGVPAAPLADGHRRPRGRPPAARDAAPAVPAPAARG